MGASALLRKVVHRLRGTQPIDPDREEDEIDAHAAVLGAGFVDALGLEEDSRPVRDYAWWRPPEKVLVTAVSERRVEWLRAAVPGVRVIGVRWGPELVDAARDADAVIGWCTGPMIAASPQLRWIQLGAAGIERLLALPELRGREILLTNMKRAAGPVIAEHTFAMLLSLTRALHRHTLSPFPSPDTYMAAGPASLQHRRLLVAGYGGIGSEVARLGRAFGMHVTVVRSRDGADADGIHFDSITNLRELAAAADVVVNALPLTAGTRGLFDTAFFDALRPGAYFVNVARGESVVTDALVAALRSRQLAGAALDVTDPEPLPRRHALRTMRNVVITPHVAGHARETQAREWLVKRENLRRYCAGEPMLSVVDPARGY